MLSNSLKSALRHLLRRPLYTSINVLGLALGICGCLVVYLISSFEFSFDKSHPDRERIYCVDPGITGATDDHAHWNAVPVPLPVAMRREMSGFESVAAFLHYKAKVTIPESKGSSRKFDGGEGIIIAEPAYFDILPYTWLSGNPKTALQRPHAVVLTENRAQNYFGNLTPEQMLGRMIRYNDSLIVSVTGILKDWPGNSDFNFTQFISYATINSSFLKNSIDPDNWFKLDHASQVLVKLSSHVSPGQVDAQFPSLIHKHLDPSSPHSKLHMQLQPFTGIHFHPEYGGEGRKASLPILYILMGVAIFILLIAAINFINLATAQSLQRTKETAVRKVLGISRGNLIFQYLAETLCLSFLAAVIAVAMVQPVLNLFAAYIPHGVSFSFSNGWTWLFLLLTVVLTALLAGIYPAKLLANFNPIQSLKGEVPVGSSGRMLRKMLLVFQFTISMIFIVSTMVITGQLNFMQTRDLGFKTDAVVTLRTLWNDHSGKMKVLAAQIKSLPGVSAVIQEAFPPMGQAHMGNGIQLKGSGQQPLQASEQVGNEDFVPFYQMKIVAGRNLAHTDSTRELLINETGAKALGFTEPAKAIGSYLTLGGGKAYPIAGVVADFHESSFHQQIGTVVVAHDPTLENGLAIKLDLRSKRAGDLQKLLRKVQACWQVLYPEEPFDYAFLDDAIAALYKSDLQTRWLTNTAMLLTIFISCMGLFGLAMFTTERRIKEIGIRKVLGAGVLHILALLSAEITQLVLIAFCIATPVAWLLMNDWLQGFAYHTDIPIWMIVLSGVGALVIALFTISFQSLKAARATPVKSLKIE